jgi:hypothetical protein
VTAEKVRVFQADTVDPRLAAQELLEVIKVGAYYR